MKGIMTLCSLLIMMVPLSGQQDLWLISPYGSEYAGEDCMVSASMGEVVIETFRTNNALMTQGFHQSFDVGTHSHSIDLDLSSRIYPNPFADILQIDIEDQSGSIASGYEVVITDMLGRVQYRHAASISETISLTVDTHRWIPGMYFIRIENEANAFQIFKTIKQ